MFRWKNSLLLFVLAATFAQSSSPLLDPHMRRVGDHLKCLCGCKATVTSCDMPQCHYSSPVRMQIASLISEGKSDDAIIQTVAHEKGLEALIVPPREGFFAVGWFMPFVIIAAGIALAAWYLQKVRAPQAAAVGAPSSPALDRYRAQIDADLEKFDE